MSDRPTNTSTDWRRRPRRERRDRSGTVPGQVQDRPVEPEQEVLPPGDEQEVVASRTLYSFIEPAVDLIATFGTPIVIAGIVGIIAGAVVLAFVPALRDPYGYITLGLGIGLVGLIALISLSTVFAAFLSRTGRYGVNSLVMLGAFLGIIVIINFISFGNNSRTDVTATQQFSLADSTRNLLRELDEPVQAIAFYRSDLASLQQDQIIRRAKVEDTLSEFQNRSNNFTYKFVDPDLEPEIARNYGVNQYESIVVEGMESGEVDIVQPTDQVYSELEQDLYTSILVATGQEQKKVYFLAGHGEKIISSTTGDGYSSIVEGLERDSYQVETLRWNPGEEDVSVPEDAALLVIAGPSGELPEAHARILGLYLQGKNADGAPRREGGRLIFLAEPDTKKSFQDFLGKWGVAVGDGYIRDLDRSVPSSPQTLRVQAYNYATAPPQIVQPRGTPLDVSFMPGATSLRPAANDRLRVPIPLAASSANSYLIDDVERTEPITDGEQSDPSGPFFPAMYVQAVGPVGGAAPTSEPPRNQISGLVVFGDSDFLANSFVNRGSGAAMFLNSANYLLGDYSLVSIRDYQYVFREWPLDNNQFNFVRFSSWFFLPGLMGLMAALVWWVRR
jgi:ABC-type uncharacterized transport system involved in gliding motility auxiliary subunit